MLAQTIQLNNPSGLQARAASLFVQVAKRYEAGVYLQKDGRTYNGKSIMSVLSMGAGCGSIIDLRVVGDDEPEAMDGLLKLLNEDLTE